MPGSPDFLKYAQWQSANLVGTYTSVLSVGANPSGVFPSAAWSGAAFRVKPSIGHGSVVLEWWTDAGQTTQIRADSWAVNTSCGLEVRMPTFGPFVSANIMVTSTSAMTALTSLFLVNNAGPEIEYPITQSAIHVSGKSVALSTTDTQTAPWIRKGLASLSYTPGDNSGKLQPTVCVLNADGTLNYPVMSIGAPVALFNQLLVVPDDLLALRVVNTDATAAHTYTATLSMQ